MRVSGPLHDGHLGEAVRRGVITDEQREAILAMARSESLDPDARSPDLRWTVVVQVGAAILCAVVPGITLLARTRDERPAVLLVVSLAAMGLFGVLGRVARERGWGRAVASIFTAAMAPYAGGAAMFALDAAWRGALRNDEAFALLPFAQRELTFAALLATGALVAIAAATWIAHRRPNGPVWSTVGVGITPLVLAAAIAFERGGGSARLVYVALVAIAALGTAAAWALRPRLQRGGVDGATWFELGVLAPLLAAGSARLAHDGESMIGWLVAASIVAGVGLLARRWTYQLVGALGVLAAVFLGLRDGAVATRAGSIVAVSALFAVAAHWIRRAEARRVAPSATTTSWE